MNRYPIDPNRLIAAAVNLNELARDLAGEGWCVVLKATEDGSRIWVEIRTSRSCDPCSQEAA